MVVELSCNFHLAFTHILGAQGCNTFLIDKHFRTSQHPEVNETRLLFLE